MKLKDMVEFFIYGIVTTLISYYLLKNTQYSNRWINIIPMYIGTYGTIKIVESKKIKRFTKILYLFLLFIVVLGLIFLIIK
ncbi:hypothetical protein J2Z60_001964 [Lactobacillus colini]|uniref:Uncharacterized protein n=1 Tax=Lactobacillus colini TaxID=1819254 RepID=A0ABS4MGG9_9LACO|nr:hypothetical protein [Lactobacillus colini]